MNRSTAAEPVVPEFSHPPVKSERHRNLNTLYTIASKKAIPYPLPSISPSAPASQSRGPSITFLTVIDVHNNLKTRLRISCSCPYRQTRFSLSKGPRFDSSIAIYC
ncbi:hypothetical protein L915_19357 [Phytophthora nicotianae]|uniref:Uncharacterized protein n=2 Tax=Phytophthora nicotianae TaxID=4792 RepID=V9E397_PHYNI|nr:hypothetical protein F443_19895 [Phytophthora nicotianae P1569]ETK73747.1 hypothetical protein L915_19357 [Phytophthora nicotianae]